MPQVRVRTTGGDKLRSRLRLLAARPSVRIEAGIIHGERYDDGTPVAYAAAINEYGYPAGGIPERPAWRAAAEAIKERLRGTPLPNALEADRIGRDAVETLKKTITEWSEPPNAPSTVARKGFDDPLIETRKLVDSIDHEVTFG